MHSNPFDWDAWLNEPQPARPETSSSDSTEGLWAEIAHLFTQLPNEANTQTTTQTAVEALSQALQSNDSAGIQTIIQTIEQTHSDTETIEILLTAMLNFCH
ncbi:MAG: hypothetical protein RMI89_11330 [Gloeomargarita sp. SKYBB_i_bin120]|nr:hypothetical protein [Gloeomargarita sp. SKYG98]MCS7293540.1 hypothetical protein [Gloeomargarita sp. SKYB120]MDW8179106.1 hypothetical protein [Gloeomargarita sp. SKYBB_i_bin120]